MSTFKERLTAAKALEDSFIEVFGSKCTTHEIVKFGQEETSIAGIHKLLRWRSDATSTFLRFLPDSVLVAKAQDESPSCLVEFKVAKTGIREDWFFANIKHQRPDLDPPLEEKEDVFGIELASIENYLKLEQIDVSVVVIGYASYATRSKLRAQYAHRIGICHTHDPSAAGQGSGTTVGNTNYRSFEPLAEFFSREFGIDDKVMRKVEKKTLKKTQKRLS